MSERRQLSPSGRKGRAGESGTACCVLALQRSADPIRYRDPFIGTRTEKHGAGCVRRNGEATSVPTMV